MDAIRPRPRPAWSTVVLAALLALTVGARAEAGTITVTTTFDQRDTVAPCSLREAVDTANQDVDTGGCVDASPAVADTIRLAGGDYDLRLSGAEDANAAGDLDVTESVTIAGAGADATAIDGNGALTGDRVLHVAAGTVTVSGLTVHGGQVGGGAGGIAAAAGSTVRIVDGSVSHNSASAAGGISTAGTLTLTRSTVDGNRAGSFAGGIFAETVTLTDSIVSGNTAVNSGAGGILATTATLTGSTVSGNTAGDGDGGGIQATTARLTRSTVSGNTAGGDFVGRSGGGIRATTVTLNRSTVTGNTANGFGGGIFGAGTLTDSSVRRNDAAMNGGGIATFAGSLTLTRTTVAGNDAGDNGGGIAFASVGALTVASSTFSGNEAANYGGAIAVEDGTTSLRSATISRNVANGGGLARLGTASVTIADTILAGNFDPITDPEYHDWFCAGGVVSQGYNLLPATAGCAVAPAVGDKAIADPRLGPLAANGGPTLTHALLATSPAIGAGNPAAPGFGGATCTATDERGVPRSLGGRCDTGAYERVSCQGRLVNVVGTAGVDSLIGTTAVDGILGLGGNDVISGGAGNDGLCGGDGNDQLRGDAGADSLNGGAGTDTCNGGTESDQAVLCESVSSVP